MAMLEVSSMSVIAKPSKETEVVNISSSVDTPGKSFQNDKDIHKTNSGSLLFYKCTLCPTPHYSKSNLLENQDEPRKTLRQFYKCEVPGCEYKTDHRRRFDNHAVVHSDKKYKCDECGFTTKSENYLKNHKDAIHNQNSQRSFCKQCSYNSTSKIRFQQHEMSHKEQGLRETYKCHFTGCPFKTVSKSSLHKHCRRHKDLSSMSGLKCTSCSYETIFNDDFQEHLRRHNQDEKMYCFNCSFKTVLKKSLVNHMLTHRKLEALEMFKCSQCSYTSKRKGNLLQHMIKHSSDIKMFKCFNCAFVTKREHTLRNHMDTHKKS